MALIGRIQGPATQENSGSLEAKDMYPAAYAAHAAEHELGNEDAADSDQQPVDLQDQPNPRR